ncbi:MAG: hypothetical protein VYC71_10080, partial [Planctomycetota bacterium]|nr:hypothetical protein [Planctomycetota bacterium]
GPTGHQSGGGSGTACQLCHAVTGHGSRGTGDREHLAPSAKAGRIRTAGNPLEALGQCRMGAGS